MGQVAYIFGLFFIAGVISASSANQYPEKNVRKSSLILEYNWPEPSKSLNRLPHPSSCNHFIHTKHDGSHIVKRCHGDKIFDYRSLRCQIKSTAKCWMNIVKKGSIKKVKRPFSCPFPWGLYADKEDCSLFYDCMGGKIYSRKCPDSTLFDVVERICVHSKKALCAGDSDGDNFKAEDSGSAIPFVERGHPHGRNRYDNLGRGQHEHREKWSWKSGNDNREREGKDRGTLQSLASLKTSSSERDADSEEHSSEEISKKHRTKSKNELITSKLSSTSTVIENPKLFKAINVDSEENSSEEIGSKYRTKSENKLIASKLPFISTNTKNPKSLRTNEYSEEENSSVEKSNEISTNYRLESKTPKIQSLSGNDYSKKLTTEKRRITPTSQSSDSSELSIHSTIIKSLFSTQNGLKPSPTPEDSGKEGNLNDNTEKISFPSERISKELTSPEEPSHHSSLKPVKIAVIPEGNKANSDINDEITKITWPIKSASQEFTLSSDLTSRNKIDSSSKIRFTRNLPTVHPTVIKNLLSKSEATTISTLCPEPNGNFPHPENRHLFIACIRGRPTIKECPDDAYLFVPSSKSCVIVF